MPARNGNGNVNAVGVDRRRTPVQARSRERVDLLLDATAALLSSEGYAAVNTNRIAREAGVPVGSLYQYFPNKEALVHALALRSLHRLDTVLDALVARTEEADLDWRALIEAGVDLLWEFYRNDAGFKAVWLGPHVSGELREADRENDHELARRIERLLRPYLPNMDAATRSRIGLVAVSISGPLMGHAVHLGERRAAAMVAETKRVLTSYLQTYIDDTRQSESGEKTDA